MLAKDLSSILLSIFKRKGGEGIYTKIIEKGDFEIEHLYNKDNENEMPLIKCYYDDRNYIIFTNQRIVQYVHEAFNFIRYFDLIEVRPAIFEEFKNAVMDKQKFTKLCIKTMNGSEHILTLESGGPYIGIYQFLSFICSKKN